MNKSETIPNQTELFHAWQAKWHSGVWEYFAYAQQEHGLGATVRAAQDA